MVPFSMPWTTPNQISRSHHYLTLNISETVRDRELQWNSNRGLHVPYLSVSFRMTLGDLLRFSVTRSIVQPLCNSSASCLSLLTRGLYRLHLAVISKKIVGMLKWNFRKQIAAGTANLAWRHLSTFTGCRHQTSDLRIFNGVGAVNPDAVWPKVY